MIGAVAGAFLVDSFGRRRLLLSGTSALVFILAIASGLLSHPETSSVRANAGITVSIYTRTIVGLLMVDPFLPFPQFIYLFMVVYSFGWTAMQAVYPAEVLTYEMRAKGLAFLAIVTQVSTCV